MRIIKRLEDSVVIYAGDDLALDETGATGRYENDVPGWRDASTTTTNAVLVEDAVPPADFTGGAYTHVDGGFVVHDAAMLEAILVPQRATAWEQIKIYRDRLSTEGGYKVGTKWFHSDVKSRTQQLGLVLLGANVPPVPWKTMDGSFVTMTQTLAGQVFAAAAAQDMAIFAKAEEHRSAMAASANPAAYDFSGGWPETFA